MAFNCTFSINLDAVNETTIANASGEVLRELGKKIFAAVTRLRQHVVRAQQALNDAHAAPLHIRKFKNSHSESRSPQRASALTGLSASWSWSTTRSRTNKQRSKGAWDNIVDSQGRSATSPTVRAAIRAKAAAPDETFRSPSKDGSDSGDSTEPGSSSKSSASTTTAEPRSATKSAGSATSGSLLLELAAKGDSGGSPLSCRRRTRAAAYRGVALRRYATRLQLHDLDDDDVFADQDDDDDGTGTSPGKKMANMSVKDEVIDDGDVGKENIDVGLDPWGGVPAPDPWNAPATRGQGRNIADSWHHYRPMRSRFAEEAQKDGEKGHASSSTSTKQKRAEREWASSSPNKDITLPEKQVKAEKLSDDDFDFFRGNKCSVGGVQRKRNLGQRVPSKTKPRAIEVVTLSSDEDEPICVPAKKAKKRANDAIVYVLSSDSEDHRDAPQS